MVIYIVVEGYEKYKDGIHFRHKLLFEELSGQRCLMVHFSELAPGEVESLSPSAIVYSGCGTSFKENGDVLTNPALMQLMADWQGPQLAICGSFQLKACYDGGTIEPIGLLGINDVDHNPGYKVGMKKESGVYPIYLTGDCELFEGLGKTIKVWENHGLEIKEMPENFVPLAHSDLCKIQAYRIKGRQFFATQFHPEKPEILEQYPDGKKLLANFFKLVIND